MMFGELWIEGVCCSAKIAREEDEREQELIEAEERAERARKAKKRKLG
jgi:hypothetical protein